MKMVAATGAGMVKGRHPEVVSAQRLPDTSRIVPVRVVVRQVCSTHLARSPGEEDCRAAVPCGVCGFSMTEMPASRDEVQDTEFHCPCEISLQTQHLDYLKSFPPARPPRLLDETRSLGCRQSLLWRQFPPGSTPAYRRPPLDETRSLGHAGHPRSFFLELLSNGGESEPAALMCAYRRIAQARSPSQARRLFPQPSQIRP